MTERIIAVSLFCFCILTFTASLASATTCQSGGRLFNESDIAWSKHHKAHIYCAGNDQWRYLAQWGLTGANNLAIVNGQVGIGTAEPTAALEVHGKSATAPLILVNANDDPRILFKNTTGTNNSTVGYKDGGVYLSAAGAGANEPHLFVKEGGNVGIGTTNPTYKLAVESADNGAAYFRSNHPNGFGVYGSGAIGVRGAGTSYGGLFLTSQTTGVGAAGDHSVASGTGSGVRGRTYSTSGTGISGWSIATTGTGRGVYGQSDSPDGTALYGNAPNNGYGLFAVGRAHIRGNLTTTGSIDASNNRIMGVVAPISSSDAANKAYVDSLGGRTCANGQILKFQSGVWNCAGDSTGGGGSDNLGNHKATQNLNMDGFAIINAEQLAFTTSAFNAINVSSSYVGGRVISAHAVPATGSSIAGYFQNDSTAGTGVYSSGGQYGGNFVSTSSSGTAIYANALNGGYSIRATGPVMLNGDTNVSGNLTAGGNFFRYNRDTGLQIIRTNPDSSITDGVIRISSSAANGAGIYVNSGPASSGAAGNARGVYATTSASTGHALAGWAMGSTGVNYGVYGRSSSSTGYGVYCLATNASGCGGNRAWTNASDGRLKDDVADLPSTDGLAAIMKLRPVTYQWRTDNSGHIELGFIAQEVEDVLPQLVGTSPDTTITLEDGTEEDITDVKSLSYSGFVVPLVKAVQELKTENDDLRSEVSGLRLANDNFRRELDELKAAIAE